MQLLLLPRQPDPFLSIGDHFHGKAQHPQCRSRHISPENLGHAQPGLIRGRVNRADRNGRHAAKGDPNSLDHPEHEEPAGFVLGGGEAGVVSALEDAEKEI